MNFICQTWAMYLVQIKVGPFGRPADDDGNIIR